MPYKVKPKGDKFCVVVSSGPKEGKEVACHDKRPDAVKQVRALYANDAAAEQSIGCLDPDCDRSFFTLDLALRHGDTVHGTDDAKQFSTEKRQKLAKQGKAMPAKNGGGGFPIENEQDLKNAIRAFGRAKDKPAAKAHIIRRAKALKLTSKLPKAWNVSTAALEDIAFDVAAFVECPEHPEREFRSVAQFLDHADSMHTFSDIESLVGEAVREKYYKPGNYKANPPVSSVWAWVRDLATDWVVFIVEKEGDSTLYKASYSITDGAVTLGDPVEVKRRTVYEEVKKEAS